VNAGEVHAIIGPNGSAEVDILAQAPAQEIFT
jgi:Fe-S cluster assembly ATPase SufC